MSAQKPHLSIVICGHVDSGKSTTAGRLLFELGGISQLEVEKLKGEAAKFGKESFAFAFYMDRRKEERERGVTIACTATDFFTDRWHYTMIDAPGHRDFIKNMISGAAQADISLLLVPADSNFLASVQKGDANAGEVQGQTRQHARILYLLGIRQLIVGINKMDSDTVGFRQERFEEVRNAARNMLVRVGWKKDFVTESVPIIPLSGWMGDNLVKNSDAMKWWIGGDFKACNGIVVKVTTLFSALNDFAQPPVRAIDAPMRCPIWATYTIKGVGDVLSGRVEQGIINTGEDVIFVPAHSSRSPCIGRICSLEMHHQRVDIAGAGDTVGIHVKGLDKNNMPRSGDVMVCAGDSSLKSVMTFTAQIQTLDTIPGEIKVGYSPIGFVRSGRAACRMSTIDWKIGQETGGVRVAMPPYLKANEVAQVQFSPSTPLVCVSYKHCDGMSRICFVDGNSVVMFGKVTETVSRDDGGSYLRKR